MGLPRKDRGDLLRHYEKYVASDFNLRIKDVVWILKKLYSYIALALSHGYAIAIPLKFRITLYYERSYNISKINSEGSWVRTPVIYGLFFTPRISGSFMEKRRYDFKPYPSFKRELAKNLNDPDLIYKLIEE